MDNLKSIADGKHVTVGTSDAAQKKHKVKSLNRNFMKNEADRIDRENIRFCQRIINAKPSDHLQRGELEGEYQEKYLKFKRRLC